MLNLILWALWALMGTALAVLASHSPEGLGYAALALCAWVGVALEIHFPEH